METEIYLADRPCGVLRAEERGLYTHFTGRMDALGLGRLLGVFEGGRLNLGVPVPAGEGMELRAGIPSRCLPGGRLLRGELVLEGWEPFPGGRVGDLNLPRGQRRGNSYRFPWKPGERLPCDDLLCFFSYEEQGGRGCLRVELDRDGRPLYNPPETGETDTYQRETERANGAG